MRKDSIVELINEIKRLPQDKQRAISAIVGAAVADAATRPLHWIYNQQILDNIIKDSKTPEFWPQSQSPYYTLPTGFRSAYNDTTYVGLWSLSSTKGVCKLNDIYQKLKLHFGPGTEYQEALKRRHSKPVVGPWIHGAVISFLENFEHNSQGPFGDIANNQSDGFCLSIPFVAYFAAKDNLWNEILKPIVTTLTTHKETVISSHIETLLLQAYILGKESPSEYMKTEFNKAYPGILGHYIDVERNQNQPFIETVAKFGRACYLPGSFKGGYLAMLQSNSYVEAVRLNITGGGCNCSRANLIGSCFGAKYGIDAIPLEWIEKTDKIENIMKKSLELFSHQ